jgi:2-polyprenyl-3-methyl-5-hydroxy-6-metoxy-1,4-benzoquinol methylase
MPETVEECVLCGSTRLVRWKQIDDWSIDKCRYCGLAVLNPHPTDEEMFKTYSGYWGYPPKPTDPDEKAREVARQTVRVEIVNQLRVPGRWLDVGTGTGTVLARARQDHWDVYGCEIAEHLITYAAQEYDLSLYKGTLQTYQTPFKFDVVSMYHILEHVTLPLDLLQAAHDRLRKDGLLVVEVPNTTSLDARLEGKKWQGWSLPIHFFHFTPNTLTKMLEHCNFRVIRMDYSPSQYFYAWWVKPIRRIVALSTLLRLLSGDTICAYAVPV